MEAILPRLWMPRIKDWMLDRRYDRFYKKCEGLHIPVPRLVLKRELFDKDGNRLWKRERYSHSWCRNGYNWAFATQAFKMIDDSTWEGGKISLKDTGGTIEYDNSYFFWLAQVSSDLDAPATILGALAPAANDDFGILIGTGTAAESFEDYALASQIADGTGAGEMSHVQSELHSIGYAALVLSDDLVRYFNNNSGGSITVNEIALVVCLNKNTYTSPTPAYFLMARDKLSSGDVVADTAQYKVTYTISLTYPA